MLQAISHRNDSRHGSVSTVNGSAAFGRGATSFAVERVYLFFIELNVCQRQFKMLQAQKDSQHTGYPNILER